jgi:ribosomal protein S14
MNCTHRPLPEQSYPEAHDEAERRMKAGQKQRRCKACGRYVWNAYYRSVGSNTARQPAIPPRLGD